MILFSDWLKQIGLLLNPKCIYGFYIENAFLFAKLRQFKLLMKVCESSHPQTDL
jgi:hypothetical protein